MKAYPILVCPDCGGEFDARGDPDAAAMRKGVALPCNDCIRYVVNRLAALLASFG